mgnify:CR=1 FL=1
MKTIKKIISLGLLAGLAIGCEDLKFGTNLWNSAFPESGS